MAALAIDDTPAQHSIAAAGSSIRKALDCQTFIVSLFPRGRQSSRYAFVGTDRKPRQDKTRQDKTRQDKQYMARQSFHSMTVKP